MFRKKEQPNQLWLDLGTMINTHYGEMFLALPGSIHLNEATKDQRKLVHSRLRNQLMDEMVEEMEKLQPGERKLWPVDGRGNIYVQISCFKATKRPNWFIRWLNYIWN